VNLLQSAVLSEVATAEPVILSGAKNLVAASKRLFAALRVT